MISKHKYFSETRLKEKSLVFLNNQGFYIVLSISLRYNENINLFSYVLQNVFEKSKIYKKKEEI